MRTPDLRLAAVILTGGTGTRLGGADKAGLRVGGATLLEHALQATAVAAEVVVVGPQVATSRPVTWAREDPPGGGPAAGLLAGLDALVVPPDLVCALAVDMPRFTARTLGRLLDALTRGDADAACLGDGDQQQWLAAVYRRERLEAARPEERSAAWGLPVRRLVEPLQFTVVAPQEDEASDVDTWDDLRRLDD